jgi:hypothetical protein
MIVYIAVADGEGRHREVLGGVSLGEVTRFSQMLPTGPSLLLRCQAQSN